MTTAGATTDMAGAGAAGFATGAGAGFATVLVAGFATDFAVGFATDFVAGFAAAGGASFAGFAGLADGFLLTDALTATLGFVLRAAAVVALVAAGFCFSRARRVGLALLNRSRLRNALETKNRS